MEGKVFRELFAWRIEEQNLVNEQNMTKITENDILTAWRLQLDNLHVPPNDLSILTEREQSFNLRLSLWQPNKPTISVRCKLVFTRTKESPPIMEPTYAEEWLIINSDESLSLTKIRVWINEYAVQRKLINYYPIYCEMDILEANAREYREYFTREYAQAARLLARDLFLLLSTDDSSDVELVSRDEQRFRAHRCVLAARSPVFAAMFKPPWKESRDGVVKIDDIDGEHLRRLLDYVYAGNFEDSENDNIGIAAGLLVAADKYLIEKLKAKCAEALSKRLNEDNVFAIHIFADAHCSSELKELTMDFIVGCPQVINSPDFLEAEKTNPQLVIEILRHKWRPRW